MFQIILLHARDNSRPVSPTEIQTVATLRGVKCVSKGGRAASLSAKSLSRLRPVENPQRKHRAEVGRASERAWWRYPREKLGSLLKRLYDRTGNSALDGPFTRRYSDEMNS